MSITKKYKLRTKPVEAVYLTEDNVDEVLEWCDGTPSHLLSNGTPCIVVNVQSTYGMVGWSLVPTTAVVGRHVIFKNSMGYFVVLTVKRFEELWEPVVDIQIVTDRPYPIGFPDPRVRPLDTVVDN